MHVFRNKNLSPKLRLATLHKIPGLLLKHRIVIGDSDQLVVTKSFRISDVSKVRIPFLAELSDNKRFVELEEYLGLGMILDTQQSRTLFSFKNASGLLLLSI